MAPKAGRRRGVQGEAHVHDRYDRPERGHRTHRAASIAKAAPGDLSCSSPASPAVDATIKWKAKGGKVNPTDDRVDGRSSNTDEPAIRPRTTATAPRSPGSYAEGRRAPSSSVTHRRAGGLQHQSRHEEVQVHRARGRVDVRDPELTVHSSRSSATTSTARTLHCRSGARTGSARTTPRSSSRSTPRSRAATTRPGVGRVAGTCTSTRWRGRAPRPTGSRIPTPPGLVSTKDHFTFKYGYMEARLWTAPGTGAIRNWPAFWANGTGVHPAPASIDVFEGLAGQRVLALPLLRWCTRWLFEPGEPLGLAHLRGRVAARGRDVLLRRCAGRPDHPGRSRRRRCT